MKIDMRFLALALCLASASAAFGAAPTIQAVVNAANSQPTFASATWVAIYGSNLSATTNIWTDSSSGKLPTSLDGVSVTFNGVPAYPTFVSPNQINVLAPDDPATGMVPVVITNSFGTSSAFAVNKQAAAPAFFVYSEYGGLFAIAQAAVTYQLVAPTGIFGPGTTVPAAPGEVVILYGTGFGPVTPPQPSGDLVQSPAPTASPVTVTIGGQNATVLFAGLIGAGLYQLNVMVPLVSSGNQVITASVGGVAAVNQPLIPIETIPGQITGQASPPLVGCLTGQVDYVTYSLGYLNLGHADEASIGGTHLCATCQVKPPIYPEFVTKMEKSIYKKETVQACFDVDGVVYQMKVMKP